MGWGTQEGGVSALGAERSGATMRESPPCLPQGVSGSLWKRRLHLLDVFVTQSGPTVKHTHLVRTRGIELGSRDEVQGTCTDVRDCLRG